MRIYIGNVSFDTNQETIEKLFSEYGTVEKTQLMTDFETGESRGFAFLEMADDEAEKAIEALNGYNLEGRSIRLDQARPRR